VRIEVYRPFFFACIVRMSVAKAHESAYGMAFMSARAATLVSSKRWRRWLGVSFTLVNFGHSCVHSTICKGVQDSEWQVLLVLRGDVAANRPGGTGFSHILCRRIDFPGSEGVA